MKAAVIYPDGGVRVADVPEPVPQSADEIVVTVKAVAIKHLDKSRASGRHYSSEVPKGEGRVVGGDGVCLLPDGTRVYALGAGGMLAEKAIIEKDRMVPLPEGLEDAVAAALPNAVIGAAMGLRFKADIQPGDVVLVNGATGFTGRIAVQLAKQYGAKKVIATGRNPESLSELMALGADEAITVAQDDDGFLAAITRVHAGTPIDIVIDYLWGHSAEMILGCLKGKGNFTNKVRFVSVGSMTGDRLQLSAANLRSVNLQLSGSGLGAWSRPQVGQLFREILPEAFQLAAEGRLTVGTTTVSLPNIENCWAADLPGGRRLVVMLD